MTETLFVTGVVIANGIEDTDGDLLTKKDIKTIFTKYINRDTDTMHTNIRNEGVDVIANWIAENETTVANQNVPAGSWMATFKITNPKLVECIKNGKLQGLSLGSVSEEAMTPKYWFINKSMNYRDLNSIEEVIPLFISFVDRPANRFKFEVMEYDAYINKNNKNGVTMTEQEEMVSVSTIERIKELFISKAEEPAPVEEPAEEDPAEDKVSALFEKLDIIIEQNNQILEGLASAEDDEEIEKAEEDDEDNSEETSEEKEEEEAEEEIEKSEEGEGESEATEEAEAEDEDDADDDAHIEKRQTSMTENQIVETTSDFYAKTGRDAFGRKIKNL